MSRVVLRWPLALDPAGRLLADSTHSTGLRFACTSRKRTFLGAPRRGLSLPFLEQASASIDAERLVLLTSVFLELAKMVPTLTLHSVTAVKLTDDPRGLYIDVLYSPRDTPEKSSIFRFALPTT